MSPVRTCWMVLGCLAMVGRAQAQQPMSPYETNLTGPVQWNLGGTLAIPSGASSNRANVGGGLTAGVTFFPTHTFGLQGEYGANWYTLKTGGVQGAGIHGNGLGQYFDANAVVRPFHGRTGFYVLGGGGLYYRRATVSRVDGVAAVPYCDPYLFFCSATAVPTSTILGTRSRWDWGLDAGAGVTFALTPPLRLYFEIRYHYIFGPTFHDSNGNSRKADGQFVPLTIGLQF